MYSPVVPGHPPGDANFSFNSPQPTSPHHAHYLTIPLRSQHQTLQSHVSTKIIIVLKHCDQWRVAVFKLKGIKHGIFLGTTPVFILLEVAYN